MHSGLVTLLVFAAVACRVALSGSASGSGSGYAPFCDPQDYTQTPAVPIPTLPDQFFTLIEGNIVQYKSTFIIAEHYDDPGNRGRFDIVSETEDREVAIFDYDLGEAFLIPDLDRNVPCGVQLLSGPSQFVNSTFGVTYVNGSVHIGTVTQLFQLAANESANYLGVETVRGIPCNRWQTCHVLENNSYTLDYYFVSTSEWQYVFSGESIPVQILLNGLRITEDGALDLMEHIYSFVAFHSGPSSVPDSVFEVPTGLPCLGRIPGEGLPEVPPFFSMLIESVSVDTPNYVGVMQEFYDTNLFRVDVQFNNSAISIIHDFELEVQYIINRHVSYCEAQPLNLETSFGYDGLVGPNGTLQQRSPTSFFRIGSGYNFSYEGVTTIRGIEADAWISVRDSFSLGPNSTIENGTVELFYTRPGWISTSRFSTNYDPVPLAVNITGTQIDRSCGDEMCGDPMEFSALYNIFDFSAAEPDFDVFDTSLCAAPNESHILAIIIPGQELGLDLRQLRRSIRTAITDWAGIPALQVANIEILGENETDIFATLQIIPIPSVARFSNPRIPIDILEEILDATSADDELPFAIELTYDSYYNGTVTVFVKPFLLRVDPDCPISPTTTTTMGAISSTTSSTTTAPSSTTTSSTMSAPSSTTTSSTTTAPSSTATSDPRASDCPKASPGSSGLSTGAVAGLAIGMFFLGILCAFLLVLILKCFRSRQHHFKMNTGSYRKQEDELEEFAD